MDDWVLVAHSDAAVKSMPDKITSVGGHVVLMCNRKSSQACILQWKSKTLRRKIMSSLAGETLAMISTVGEIVYTLSILELIFGERVRAVPRVVVIDPKDLEEAVLSSGLVSDSWLIPDIAVLKEAFEERTFMHLRRVNSAEMLAYCLMKKGASGEALMNVMRTGTYSLPGGWPLGK